MKFEPTFRQVVIFIAFFGFPFQLFAQPNNPYWVQVDNLYNKIGYQDGSIDESPIYNNGVRVSESAWTAGEFTVEISFSLPSGAEVTQVNVGWNGSNSGLGAGPDHVLIDHSEGRVDKLDHSNNASDEGWHYLENIDTDKYVRKNGGTYTIRYGVWTSAAEQADVKHVVANVFWEEPEPADLRISGFNTNWDVPSEGGSQTGYIHNDGELVLNWNVQGGDRDWINVTPSGSSINPGEIEEVSIKVEGYSSNNGYDDQVIFANNDILEDNEAVKINTLSPSELEVTNHPGGSDNTWQVPPKGEAQTVSFKNDGEEKLYWNVEPNASWIEVNEKSGELNSGDGKSITLTVGDNDTGSDNSGYVDFNNKTERAFRLFVEQERMETPADLVLETPSDKTYSYKGDELTIQVRNEGSKALEWIADHDYPEWLTVEPDEGTVEGSGKQSVSITIGPNNETTSKSGKIYFENKNNSSDSDYITIEQEAAPITNSAPIGKASDISGQPNQITAGQKFQVKSKYFDPDGRDDLQTLYLRLYNPNGKTIELIWDNKNGKIVKNNAFDFLNSEPIVSQKAITQENFEGYELTWDITINDNWPEANSGVYFEVLATDYNNKTSTASRDNSNMRFAHNDTSPPQVEVLRLKQIAGPKIRIHAKITDENGINIEQTKFVVKRVDSKFLTNDEASYDFKKLSNAENTYVAIAENPRWFQENFQIGTEVVWKIETEDLNGNSYTYPSDNELGTGLFDRNLELENDQWAYRIKIVEDGEALPKTFLEQDGNVNGAITYEVEGNDLKLLNNTATWYSLSFEPEQLEEKVEATRFLNEIFPDPKTGVIPLSLGHALQDRRITVKDVVSEYEKIKITADKYTSAAIFRNVLDMIFPVLKASMPSLPIGDIKELINKVASDKTIKELIVNEIEEQLKPGDPTDAIIAAWDGMMSKAFNTVLEEYSNPYALKEVKNQYPNISNSKANELAEKKTSKLIGKALAVLTGINNRLQFVIDEFSYLEDQEILNLIATSGFKIDLNTVPGYVSGTNKRPYVGENLQTYIYLNLPEALIQPYFSVFADVKIYGPDGETVVEKSQIEYNGKTISEGELSVNLVNGEENYVQGTYVTPFNLSGDEYVLPVSLKYNFGQSSIGHNFKSSKRPYFYEIKLYEGGYPDLDLLSTEEELLFKSEKIPFYLFDKKAPPKPSITEIKDLTTSNEHKFIFQSSGFEEDVTEIELCYGYDSNSLSNCKIYQLGGTAKKVISNTYSSDEKVIYYKFASIDLSGNKSPYTEIKNFQINEKKRDILILAPDNSNITIFRGELLDIVWSSEGLTGKIKLELVNSKDYKRKIGEWSVSEEIVTWEIPSNVPEGLDYKVKITSLEDETVFDESEETFAIVNTPEEYVVSGVVVDGSNDPLKDVELILSGDANQTVNTSSSGEFSFNNLTSGTYTISPSFEGYSFSPNSKEITIESSDVTDIKFVGTKETKNLFTISGQIIDSNGNGLSGANLSLTGETEEFQISNTDGSFEFSNLNSGNYVLTPSQNGYTFDPDSLNIEITDSDKTGLSFTATKTQTHSLKFASTEKTYSEAANLEQICTDTFGSNYQLADWTDIEKYYQDKGALTEFFENLEINEEKGKNLLVSRNGERYYSTTNRHYFISRHNHDKPDNYLAHDHIDNYLLSLGSWYNMSMRVLCFTDQGVGNEDLPPAAPKSLTANYSNETVQLSWNKVSADDLKEYWIFKGTSPTPTKRLTTVSENDTSYADSDVQKGGTYYYRVAAVDKADSRSNFSNEVSITIPHEQEILGFVEDFNDGDFSQNPSWIVDNNDDYKGEVNVVDQSLKILRKGAGANGGGVGIKKSLNIPVTDSTQVIYDVKAVYSDVRNGSGDKNREYPISIFITLELDNNTEALIRYAYNYRGGSDIIQDDFIQIVKGNIEQDKWLRGESFRITDHFINAESITEIRIYGNGWNFEGWADNIEITTSSENKDKTAPVIPQRLTAKVLREGVELDWDINIEADFSHFNIYRSNTSEFQTSNHNLLKEDHHNSSYLDKNLSNGHYWYRVTAVDESDNESKASNEVSIYFANSVASNYPTGWKLISIPLDVQENSVNDLYPNANPNSLYSFQGSYKQDSVLEAGKSYWIEFQSDQKVKYQGKAIDSLGIELDEGWNLVGTLSDTITTEQVIDSEDILMSPFWKYENGVYTVSGNVIPGQGYWVRSTTAGAIHLSLTSKIKSKTIEKDTNSKLSSFDQLTFKSENSKQNLYLNGQIGLDLEGYYQMPPPPFEPMLDTRFKGNLYVTSNDSAQILLRSNHYPVEISLDSKNPTSYLLIVKNKSGAIDHYTLSNSNSVKLSSPVEHIYIQNANSSDGKLPKDVTLGQNYPNPFNPTTVIRYGLPKRTAVNISVFNVIGQKVSTLIDGQRNAGFHKAVFDGSNLASGMYFIRISANQTTKVQKITLIK